MMINNSKCHLMRLKIRLALLNSCILKSRLFVLSKEKCGKMWKNVEKEQK